MLSNFLFSKYDSLHLLSPYYCRYVISVISGTSEPISFMYTVYDIGSKHALVILYNTHFIIVH